MVEAVGNNISKWGEGPVWHAGLLYYVDIEGHRVCSFNPTTGEEQSWNVGERVGLVVPREQGGFVIAGDNGFSFLDPDSGETTFIADPEPGPVVVDEDKMPGAAFFPEAKLNFAENLLRRRDVLPARCAPARLPLSLS